MKTTKREGRLGEASGAPGQHGYIAACDRIIVRAGMARRTVNMDLQKFSLGWVIALLATGCAVGPDFQRPAAPTVQGYTSKPLPTGVAPAEAAAAPSQQFVPSLDIPAQWWTLFHSAPLNRLVERALQANPNLQAAQATLRQAQETFYAAEGARLPAVNASGAATRQRVNGAQFGQPANAGSVFTLYNASVSVSYDIDLFGKVRRTVEALGAQAEFERFQLEGAYLTLTSNVVTTAVQEASLRAQIAATREIIDAESRLLDMLEKQFGAGGIPRSSVLAQKTALAQTRASLPVLERQLALSRNQLAALAGYFPGESEVEAFDLEMLQLPEDLPVSLPSRLVEQRPDVRAAESLLHAASARIGVATADMLPQFTIGASVGSVASSGSRLFSSGSGIWSIGANLTQPIFHGGALRHQRRAAAAAYDAAAAQYRGVVLAAFQDVANVLDALQLDASALQAELLATQSAAESLDMARRQYEAGAASYLALLNAQQAYQQSRIALAQAQANRYSDTAALFQALGGGWWNRQDTEADRASEANK